MAQKKLVKSATTYSDLASSLKASAARDLSELTDAQLELLRLALFSHADILVELGDVEDAVGWYQYLQKNYSPQVESLIACERLWRCVPHIRQASKLAKEIPQILRASLDLAREGPARHGREQPGLQRCECPDQAGMARLDQPRQGTDLSTADEHTHLADAWPSRTSESSSLIRQGAAEVLVVTRSWQLVTLTVGNRL